MSRRLIKLPLLDFETTPSRRTNLSEAKVSLESIKTRTSFSEAKTSPGVPIFTQWLQVAIQVKHTIQNIQKLMISVILTLLKQFVIPFLVKIIAENVVI